MTGIFPCPAPQKPGPKQDARLPPGSADEKRNHRPRRQGGRIGEPPSPPSDRQPAQSPDPPQDSPPQSGPRRARRPKQRTGGGEKLHVARADIPKNHKGEKEDAAQEKPQHRWEKARTPSLRSPDQDARQRTGKGEKIGDSPGPQIPIRGTGSQHRQDAQPSRPETQERGIQSAPLSRVSPARRSGPLSTPERENPPSPDNPSLPLGSPGEGRTRPIPRSSGAGTPHSRASGSPQGG